MSDMSDFLYNAAFESHAYGYMKNHSHMHCLPDEPLTTHGGEALRTLYITSVRHVSRSLSRASCFGMVGPPRHP